MVHSGSACRGEAAALACDAPGTALGHRDRIGPLRPAALAPSNAIVYASQLGPGTAMTLELKMLALSIVLGLYKSYSPRMRQACNAATSGRRVLAMRLCLH